MNYVTILACAAILFVSLAVFAIAARKMGARFIATVCIMVTALELVIFIVWPIPNYRYESVEVTALNAANAEAGGKEVFIKSVTMRGAEIVFPEVESGRWFWRNGMYSWRPPEDKNQPEGCTETIVLRVPVGEERAINFTSNRWKGLVAVTAGGEREERDLYSEEDGTVSVLLPDSGIGELVKNAAVRIAVYLGIHGAVLIGVILVCRYLLEKIAAAIGKCRYELAFCAYAFMMFLRYGAFTNPNSSMFLYNSAYYVNGYEFGFIKRGLIGQLAMSLTPYISEAQLKGLLQVCTLVVVVLLSILLGRAVRRQKSEAARWFFVLVVCSFPSTFMFVSDPLRPDIYEIILFIACAAAVYKGKALWSIPMLVCVIMLINETSCAYMVPPILMMLAYKWAKSRMGGYPSRRYMAAAAASFAVTALMTGIMLFAKDPRLGIDYNGMHSHIQKHLGVALGNGVISTNLSTLKSNLAFMVQKWAQYFRNTSIMFLLLMPACLLLGMLWVLCFRKWTAERKQGLKQKILFWLMPLSGLGAFVPMVFACDFGRYFAFLLSEEIVMFIFFICVDEMQLQLQDLCFAGVVPGEKRNGVPVTAIAVCVFYILYGALKVNAEWDISYDIIKLFNAIAH